MPLSPREREEYQWCNLWARAVGWEAWALANVVHGLTIDDLTLIEEMALVEAALTHIRCLAEFLVGRGGKKRTARPGWDDRDLSPIDALPTWDLDSRVVLAIREDMKRIDEQTAHVTLQRLPLVSASWNLEALREKIIELFAQFVAELRAAHSPYGPHLEPWLEAARNPWGFTRNAVRGGLASLPRQLTFAAKGTNSGAHVAIMAPVLDDPSKVQRPSGM